MESQSLGSIFFITFSKGVDGVSRVEWVGSAMIWFLIALSVVNIALIVTLAMRNRRSAILPIAFANRLRDMAASGRGDEAATLARAEASDFSRMLSTGVRHHDRGLPAMVRVVEQTSEELVVARFRSIETLNVLGQVAPMIGLFGTVYGMIMAFRSLAATAGSADPMVLAGGIGTALVTTFWGLFIAIPALAAYAAIRNKVDSVSTEATRRVEEMLDDYTSEDSSAASSDRTRPGAAGRSDASDPVGAAP